MLSAERLSALARLRDFGRQALLEAFCAGQALGHGGELFATGDHALLQLLEITSEVGEFLGGLGGFGFGGSARTNGFGMFRAGLGGAGAGGFGVGMQAGDFGALAIKLQIDPQEFAAGFVALVRGGDQGFFGFDLLRGGGRKRQLARGGFFLDAREIGLLIGNDLFQTRGF